MGRNRSTCRSALSCPTYRVLGQSQTPLLGLNALIDQAGGTLAGGQTLYYAVTEVDSGYRNPPLSFVVRASVPGATNTNAVTLQSLSFSSAAQAFRVYRGPNPTQLLQIAANQAIAAIYTDIGATTQLIGPPDFNFDHANFYWRSELQPEEAATIFGANTIGNATLNMPVNVYAGKIARITAGLGGGLEGTILSNTATTVTVTTAWSITPDDTSEFLDRRFNLDTRRLIELIACHFSGAESGRANDTNIRQGGERSERTNARQRSAR